MPTPIQPRRFQTPPGSNPRRLFLYENGWRIALKAGSDREFCFMTAPGQDYYHRLLEGEIYLARGDEKLCLACADAGACSPSSPVPSASSPGSPVRPTSNPPSPSRSQRLSSCKDTDPKLRNGCSAYRKSPCGGGGSATNRTTSEEGMKQREALLEREAERIERERYAAGGCQFIGDGQGRIAALSEG